MTPIDVIRARTDTLTADERLGLLNAIIAASAKAASLTEMLPLVLDAVCERYPGLYGALAQVTPRGAEVTLAKPSPPFDWSVILGELHAALNRPASQTEPVLLSRRREVVLAVPLAPVDGVRRMFVFADPDDVVHLPRGVMAAIAVECSYVLDRELAAQVLKEREAQLRAVFDASPMAQALMRGDDRRFAAVNDALCRLVGYSREELIGTSARTITHPDDVAVVERARELAALDPAGQRRVERRLLHSTGAVVVTETMLTWIDPPGGPRMLLQQITDITAQRRAERDLLRQAETDGLTGMPNRLRLVREMGDLAQAGRSFAVLFLDVDSFKSINDSRGHAVGDEILVEVARRLERAAGQRCLVGRFGGDEFVVLCRGPALGPETESAPGAPGATGGVEHPGPACGNGSAQGSEHRSAHRSVNESPPPRSLARATRDLADRIQQELARPIDTSTGPAHVTVSIGICDDTIPVDRPLDRLQYADTAAYQAKRQGEDRQVVYDTPLHRRTTEYRRMESLLRSAVEEQRLVLHYQPIVDVANGTPVGVEALVRLRDERGHLVSPEEFIEVAERSGLIVPMGGWVLAEACRTVARLRRSVGIPLRVSVNVAARQVARAGIAETVIDALRQADLPPEALTLELTESALLEAESATLQRLNDLRASGVRIALDDFGTGYSSLVYLRRLPVTSVKVDRSFVDSMTTDSGSAAIVRTVTALARDLGLSWVAEGVETAQQWQALRALGPGMAQGFFFARPQPADVLAHTLGAGAPGSE